MFLFKLIKWGGALALLGAATGIGINWDDIKKWIGLDDKGNPNSQATASGGAQPSQAAAAAAAK